MKQLILLLILGFIGTSFSFEEEFESPGAWGMPYMWRSGVVHPESPCRYWCKTPEDELYCCETLKDPQLAVGSKPGNCPSMRDGCTRVVGLMPFVCSSDGACFGEEKCCYDRCLDRHICKPPASSATPPIS